MGKHVKKMEDGDYTIDGNQVCWSGDLHESWCTVANQMTSLEVLSVLCSAQYNPQPHGGGAAALEQAGKDAAYASATNCGRQLSLAECVENGPMTRGQLLACDILLEAKRAARRHGVAEVAVLRLLLCVRSHGQQNGPHDSYLRLCVGALKQF